MRYRLFIAALAAALSALAGTARAFPAGQQTFHILGYDNQIQEILLAIDIGEGGPFMDNPLTEASSEIAVTVPARGQILIFDHGEDGYEADYSNIPAGNLLGGGGTTEIWGDGILANGSPPGDPGGDDLLDPNQTLRLESSSAPDAAGCAGTTCDPIPLPRNFAADTRYGGEDVLFTVGAPLNVVHVMYPSSTTNNTVFGGTWEVFPREAYSENLIYTIPVGVDSYAATGGAAGPFENFKYAFIVVQAVEDATPVVVDNGATTVTFSLDAGQSWSSQGFIDAAPGSTPALVVNQNTRVTAGKPVQVGMVAGGDGRLQSRFFNILPTGLYAGEYVSPVFSRTAGDQTFSDVIVNNPNPGAIAVTATDSVGPVTLNIPGNSPASFQAVAGRFVPTGSSLRLRSDDLFWGIGVYDRGGGADGTGADWGYALQSSGFVQRDVAVPHGPGNRGIVDPGVADTGNGSPVWVAPLDDATTFSVDWDGDGAADPTDIDNDGVSDGTTFTRDALQALTLYDVADNDQTGGVVSADGQFATAWGYRRTQAGADPGLTNNVDWGYTVNPFDKRFQRTVLDVTKSVSPKTVPAGGTAAVEICAETEDLGPVTDVDLVDLLPACFNYVAGSATITYPDGTAVPVEPAIAGPQLTWDISHTLATRERLCVAFQVQEAGCGGACTPTAAQVTEDFQGPNYAGGSGWTGVWNETNDDNNPNGGQVFLVGSGTGCEQRRLDINGGPNQVSIVRRANLNAYCQPQLTYNYDIFNGSGGGIGYVVEAATALAGPYTALRTYTTPTGFCQAETVDLSAFAGGPIFLRYRSLAASGTGDFMGVDNIVIQDVAAPSLGSFADNIGRASGDFRGFPLQAEDTARIFVSDLRVTKAVDLTQVPVGGTLQYTLTVENSGGSPVIGVDLRDPVPEFTTLVGGSIVPAAGAFDAGANAVVWAGQNFPPGSTTVYSFQVTVNQVPFDQTPVANQAVVVSGGARVIESNEVETAVRTPIFVLTKTAPGAVSSGGDIPFTFDLRNAGDVAATGVVLTDRIPAPSQYVIGSATPGASAQCSTDNAATFAACPAAPPGAVAPAVTHVRFTVGTIAAGAAATAGFTARDPGSAAGTVVRNVASLTNNETTIRTTNVTETVISDLQLTLAATGPVCPRAVVPVTLTATNASAGTAFANAEVVYPVPAETALRPGSVTTPAGWAAGYSTDGGMTYGPAEPAPASTITHVRWTRASFPAATSDGFLLELDVAADPPAGFTIETAGTIDSTATPPVPSNEVFLPTVNVRVVISSDVTAQAPGGVITYTVTARNVGVVPATNVSLAVPTPGFNLFSQTTLVGGSTAPPATETPTSVTWALGDLFPLAPAFVGTFQATVNGGAALGSTVDALAEATHDVCTAFSEPRLVLVGTPDITGGPSGEAWGDQGDTICYAANLVNTGGVAEVVDFLPQNDQDPTWPDAAVQVFEDVDGDGVLDPGLDTLTTDTGGLVGFADTGLLNPGETFRMLICVPIPAAAADGDVNVTTFSFRGASSGVVRNFTETTNVISATAVTLLDFAARGDPAGVAVTWRTGSERQNRGFYLARSRSRTGPWSPVGGLVPGRVFSAAPVDYRVVDRGAPATGPLYYRLEDLDFAGARRPHGPVAVDRDGDGAGFDAEARWGFSDADPGDLAGDHDGDGVPTAVEVALGRDPRAADAAPPGTRRQVAGATPPAPGVHLVAEDDGGWEYEFVAGPYEVRRRLVAGAALAYPRLPGVITGPGGPAGYPDLPVAGVALPAGAGAARVLAVTREALDLGEVGPAPRAEAVTAGAAVGTRPVYRRAPAFYGGDAPWPAGPAAAVVDSAGGPALRFYPFSYDPASGATEFRSRIRVRVARGAAPKALVPDLPAGVSALPAGPAFRLRTDRPGLYRLTGAALAAAGADPAGHDPRRVRLYRGSRLIPCRVTGESDGVFDPGDALEFYAGDPGDRHAAGDGYFLVYAADPAPAGARWTTRAVGAAAGGFEAAYRHREVVEYRDYYFAPIPGPPAQTRWVAGFGQWASTFSPGGANLPVEVRDPAPGGGDGSLTLTVGASVESLKGDPDHHTTLAFDGVPLASQRWSGRGFRDLTAAVPAAAITAGTRTVNLSLSLEDLHPSVTSDFLLPQTLTLEYDRRHVAVADALEFADRGGAPKAYRLAGFTTGDATLLDVSDPDAPVLLTGAAVTGAGPFALEFTDTAPASARYLAVTPAAAAAVPASGIRPVATSGLRGPAGADWVAITPAGWEATLAPLVDLRRAQGLRTRVVSLDQVADEFAGGVAHPEAIRRFMAYARSTWSPRPRYLLLVGDANANPRGHPGAFFTSDPVTMPAPLRTSGTGLLRSEVAADGWYGRLDGAPATEAVAVGRIPARNPAELGGVVAKLVAYAAEADAPWARTMVSVADDDETNFEETAEDALALALPGTVLDRLHRRDYATGAGHAAALQGALQGGAALVQFLGHGGSVLWSSDDILPPATVGGLTNGGRLPWVISMTCEDGAFSDVFTSNQSLAEHMVTLPTGGAVAYLASGVRTTAAAKDAFHRAVLDAFFRGEARRVGDAIRAGAAAYLARAADPVDLLDGFNLFGDPATRVRVPHPLAPGGLTAGRTLAGGVLLSWTASPGGPGTFEVYRRVGLTGAATLVATVTGTQYTDSAAPPGAAFYTVRAVTADGLGSALPGEVGVSQLPAVPAPPPDNGGGGGCDGGGAGAGGWLLACLGLVRTRRRRR